MSNIFILFITLHCLGDYYLQTKKLAEKKENKFGYVLLHSLIYIIPAGLSILLFDSNSYVFYVIVFWAAHLLVDSIKYFIKSKHFYPKTDDNKKSNNVLKLDIVYFIDQTIHIISIAAIAIVFLQSNTDIALKQSVLNALNISMETGLYALKVIGAFALVLQPVSLTFYKIFNVDLMAQPAKDSAREKDVRGVGAIIGFMERIIMMVLLLIGQYTALGLVIAGKSIIRLNSDIKQEFFLIGTFYGIITSLVTYIIFFVI